MYVFLSDVIHTETKRVSNKNRKTLHQHPLYSLLKTSCGAKAKLVGDDRRDSKKFEKKKLNNQC